MENLFKPEESRKFDSVHDQKRREGAVVPLLIVVALFHAAALAIFLGVDFTLLREIFGTVLAPSLPGESARWSVDLFALTGMLFLLTFHLTALRSPDAPAVRFIATCAVNLILVYTVGAGLAFAGIIYEGADALVAQAAEVSRDLFSGPEPSAAGSGLNRLVAAFPVAFAFGCSGLAVINLFGSHMIGCMLLETIKSISTHRRAASEASDAMTVIRACQKRYAELSQEREALLAVDDRTQEVAAAHDILRAVAIGLSDYETFVIDQTVRSGESDNRFAAPLTNLSTKEIAKRVAALRAVNLKTILAALRGPKD